MVDMVREPAETAARSPRSRLCLHKRRWGTMMSWEKKELTRRDALKVVAAHETGTTINQAMAEGQIEGAVAQGIGFALMERLVHEDGRVQKDRFLDYKIPNIGDMPEIEAIFVESEGTRGPFGAKGIGEPGLVPTAPAIANAVFDAIGVRFHEQPITRDEVHKASKEKRK
jgi:xanthine dehydrogenase molybdenum-binding subunit